MLYAEKWCSKIGKNRDQKISERGETENQKERINSTFSNAAFHN